MIKYVEEEKINEKNDPGLISGKIFSEKKYYSILLKLTLILFFGTFFLGDLIMKIFGVIYFFIAIFILGIALGTFSFLWLPIIIFSSKVSKLKIESDNNKLVRFFIFFSPISFFLTLYSFASDSLILFFQSLITSFLAIKVIRTIKRYAKSSKIIINTGIIISLISSSITLTMSLYIFINKVLNINI